MFDDLKNKFMKINMIIISVVVILSFVIIFVINYSYVKKDNNDKLISASAIVPRISGNVVDATLIPNGFNLSFNIILDSKKEIIEVFSRMDLSINDYEVIANLISSNNQNKGSIKFSERRWLYNVSVVKNRREILGNINNNSQNYYQVTLLDITDSSKSLVNLGVILCVLSIVMLVVIYFISRYFSEKALIPVQNIWNKQKQFIADATHELKTPITTVNANVDVLFANQSKTIKSQLKWLFYIKSETDRMNRLINDLLYLAKSDEGDQKIVIENIDVSKIVEKMILLIEVRSFEKNIELKTDIENNVYLDTSYDMFVQLLTILLDNALKYVNENGRIDVVLKKQEKGVVFLITNTGKGIKPEDKSKIFDRFYREDKVRNSKDNSYGLGLSIASCLSNRLNSTIDVESVINEFTTFTIKFNKK